MKNGQQLLNKENWIKYLDIAKENDLTNNAIANDIVSNIERVLRERQGNAKTLIRNLRENKEQERGLLIDFCLKMEEKAMEYKHLVPSEEFIDKYLKGEF